MNTKEIVAKYNKAAAEYAKSRIGHEPKDVLAEFLGMVKQGARILDVGCAAGRDTRIFKDSGFEPTGIDLAENLLNIAKAENPDLSFVLADMRNTSFDDAELDAIWAIGVLHHLSKEEMPAALEEFRRVLKPAGVLCVQTKMGEGMLRTKENSVDYEEREFTLLTADELKDLLSKAGYSNVKVKLRKSPTRKIIWLIAYGKA